MKDQNDWYGSNRKIELMKHDKATADIIKEVIMTNNRILRINEQVLQMFNKYIITTGSEENE